MEIATNDGAQSGASLPPRNGSESVVEYYQRIGIVKGTLQIIGEQIMANRELEKMKTKPEPQKILPLTAKCDHCGDEAKYSRRYWPEGWTQTGRSKYGKQYIKSGIAWWCNKPECFEASRNLNAAMSDHADSGRGA